jgi:predicted Zn-dependent protease
LQVWGSILGFPLEFRPVLDVTEADIEFRWITRFSTAQAGLTDRQLDDSGFIERVTVTLADTHSDGMQMSDEFIRLVALHEIGHVVGLPHSENPADVMHPGNRNLKLSHRDIRSVRILYGLPVDEAQ